MDWWVTPSGTTTSVHGGSEYTKPSDAGVYYDINVSSTGGDTRAVTVRIDEPAYVNTLRVGNGLSPIDQETRQTSAMVAAIRAVDSNPNFYVSSDPVRIEIGYDELDETQPLDRISNQDLRRYLVRRLYLSWQDGSFDDSLRFGPMDQTLTGLGPDAFLRNLQLLGQEGYVGLNRTKGRGFSSFSAQPTALLVREVERYGAAKADVESEADYNARLAAHKALADEYSAIIAERSRYETSQTSDEVESVFRAVMPILEGVVRGLLSARGSQMTHSTLGPMIRDLRNRGIGALGLWSQLSAVQNNARDISLHGEDLPIAVLRLATVCCFELFPQLGKCFPDHCV